MDVSKKFSAYLENFSRSFSACIDAIRAVMYMPSPTPPAAPHPQTVVGGLYLVAYAASQPVWWPGK